MSGVKDTVGPRTLPGDWWPGTLPDNLAIDPAAHIESTFSFQRWRSRLPVGLRMGPGAALYGGTILDVGPRGQVILGDYAMVTSARIVCDSEVEVGAYSLISWDVVLLDSYGVPRDPALRRRLLEQAPLLHPRCCLPPDRSVTPQPVRIGANVWVGFGACVLPGVTIGEGAVIGARAVVANDVPPYTVVAGNPARLVKTLDP